MKGQETISNLDQQKQRPKRPKPNLIYFWEKGWEPKTQQWMPKRTVWPVMNVSERNPLTDSKCPKTFFSFIFVCFFFLRVFCFVGCVCVCHSVRLPDSNSSSFVGVSPIISVPAFVLIFFPSSEMSTFRVPLLNAAILWRNQFQANVRPNAGKPEKHFELRFHPKSRQREMRKLTKTKIERRVRYLTCNYWQISYFSEIAPERENSR